MQTLHQPLAETLVRASAQYGSDASDSDLPSASYAAPGQCRPTCAWTETAAINLAGARIAPVLTCVFH